MYVIVVYDIAVERINSVRQYLKQYLNWIQNSAFEGELKEGEVEKIKIGLKKLIKEEADSIIFYVTADKQWVTKTVLGIEKSEVTTII
ncbi:CRISPR-associated endonuclease Cas2 [Candidatus Bathyarchaeota archaeon]|nr:CRISPR-associated endonuclease Cas2 [Candidatus Bathyarchaeota archaeon]